MRRVIGMESGWKVSVDYRYQNRFVCGAIALKELAKIDRQDD